jgi:hypothetical protein
MNELLQSPLFQSVILPFIVALVVAELFQRMRLSGLAVIAAFCATLFFTNDFVFWPLTATRKLELAALLGAVVALAFDYLLQKSRFTILLAPLFAALATLWVLSSAFAQLDPLHKWQIAGGVILFVAWLTAACDGLRDDSVQASAAGDWLRFYCVSFYSDIQRSTFTDGQDICIPRQFNYRTCRSGSRDAG